MAKMRKATTVRGYGAFVGANHVEVEETLGESIGMAAEVAHGSCTDLPPSKK